MAPARTIEYIRVFSSVRHDTRIEHVAHQTGLSYTDVLGRLVLLWMFAHQQASEFVAREDAELALRDSAELDLLSVLVKRNLVDEIDAQTVRVHGVRDEIESQINRSESLSSNGVKSGQSRRKQAELQKRTNVQQGFDLGSTPVRQMLNQQIGQTTPHGVFFRSSESRSEEIKHLGVLTKSSVLDDAGAISETDPQNDSGPGPKTQQSSSQEPFQARGDRPTGIPDDAMRLGEQMVDWLTNQHGVATVRIRNARNKSAQRVHNARSIHKLHVSYGIDWLEIEQVIDWVQNHPFWSTTVITGRGLLQHWERIALQRARSTTNGHTNGHNGKHAPTTNRGRIEPMPPEAFGDGDVDV